MDFRDKVFVITGAGQGLGKAFAEAMAGEGAKVIIAEINEEKGEAAAEAIAKRGWEAAFIRTDVCDEKSVHAMAQATMARYGRIDVLVNNAGIFQTIKLKPFLEIPLEEWNQVIASHINGMFLCCKAVVPIMKTQQRGKIINFSSGVVFVGVPNRLHYVTAKAGVIGLTRALAREVGDWNICVNAIAPGSFRTEMERETVGSAGEQAMIQQRCLKRAAVAQDMIGTLMFLSSDASDFITGQLISVDGGFRHH
jgi:3-oxoacyl-[acyl-carrier protein] reductase